MRRATACFGLVGILASWAFADDARANATLHNNLGGPLGYGTVPNCVPPNDDGAWPAGTTGLDITPAFPMGLHFYAGTYTTGFVDNNGNFAFRGSVSTYTPNAFPGAQNPMIAPFWADVDTRAPSWTSYPSGGSFPAGSTCNGVYGPNGPTTNGVWWDIRSGQLTITWDRVGYFNSHNDKVMSFQMILTANNACDPNADGGVGGTNFDIEFRYNQCGWETGDASGGSGGFGGTQAVAGFDSGDGVHYAMIPGSRAAGIAMALCTGSNLTPPDSGVWRWSVRGGQVQCPNAGKPCNTGKKGICAAGQIQCAAGDGGFGVETCVPLTPPQPNKCNGLDNDCDGNPDTTCPANEVCVGSVCVPACVEGGCPTGSTCSSTSNGKVCVETSCIGVVCNATDGGVPQRCLHGMCVDSCTGVVCPLGQVCRIGSCVDPCAGLSCGMGQVCESGSCVPACPCRTCDMGKSCVTMGTTKGTCIETGCLNKTCAAGQVCQAGNCVDACTGAKCPMGQECKVGNCVDLPPPDAGADSGIIVPPMDDGGLDDATVGDGGDDGGGPNDFGGASKSSGCGCRTAGGGDDNALAIAGAVGLLAMFVGRRRRKG